MLAWLGVGFAEKATGMTAAGQYAEFSTIINSLAFIISLATLMPTLVTANPLADIVASTKTGMPEAWVKINGNTEEMVGRSAMVRTIERGVDDFLQLSQITPSSYIVSVGLLKRNVPC